MPTGKLKSRKADRAEASATTLRFKNGYMIVFLEDGRAISVPLEFYPTLAKATGPERGQWELIGDGRGITWEALDLDLSVQGLLDGAREGFPAPPVKPRRASRSEVA